MRYILPIILLVYFSPVFAHAVDEPRFVEISLLTPGQELLELSDSNLKFRKFFFQDSINHHFFGGPFGRYRIEPFQFGENFCAEGCGCLVKSGFSVCCISQMESYPCQCKCSSNSEKPQISSGEDKSEYVHSWVAAVCCFVFFALGWGFKSEFS